MYSLVQKMFSFLPEEMERHIFRFYYSMNVMAEVKSRESIWNKPSQKLLIICNELGNFQPQYSDLEKCISCKDLDVYAAIINCFNGKCGNCVNWGFPCFNAKFYGNLYDKINFKMIDY